MNDVMLAIQQHEFGTPEVLQSVQLPIPEPGISQILVRVHAASINPTDWKNRAGKAFVRDLPMVLGWDVSGVVESVGLGVTLFKPGDEVFGMLPYPYGLGAHAQYAVGPTRAFVHKPDNLSHIQAGALPLASLTAWQSLVDTARITAGDRVLIHAAAGGVGHLAVQIAKAHGAFVIGTASAKNHDFLAQLGVDDAIDYRTVDFANAVDDVDIVLDTIGGDYQLRSLRTMRPGGTMVSTIPRAADGLWEQVQSFGVRADLILVEADHAGMQAIASLAAEGTLTPHIAKMFPLREAAQAHAAGETGHTVGKMVLTIEDV
ncbi:NADP-dependent oxidoreductase [Enteractinococcus helveticum]|uniref:NADPH:quinone reductase n=1 Tax=Enteractinococcus helveticum TaxID=1837282 RepID=A0A1B7M3C6_9MICC|nr:NADP-dependent oxidoreductase [Enteractinococcus helveticum]OAV63039.1 NADPH:quinone reductase [Enteractinococcus helveticum]